MLEQENKFTLIGTVSNFKIERKDGKKAFAFVTVKSEDGKNSVTGKLYEREKFKYANKEYSLVGLQRLFLDTNGTSLGVKAGVSGQASDYAGEHGIYRNFNIFGLFQQSHNAKSKFVYSIKGYINEISIMEDDNDNTYALLKVSTINCYEKDGKKVVRGIVTKEVKVTHANIVEQLEDACANDYVSIVGYIYNQLPEYDDFGRVKGEARVEFTVEDMDVYVSVDDIDENEIEILEKAKTLEIGESFLVDSEGNIEEPELEF